MAVYLIADVTIFDQELYSDYSAQVPAMVERYGGRYLVRGGGVQPVAGDWRPERIIIVQFDTIDQVQDFLACPDYQAIVPLRQQSSLYRTIIVEGCDYGL